MGTFMKVLVFAVAFGVTLKLTSKPAEPFDGSVLAGKRVLITGASSGIGEQLAYQYAKNGAHVFITARREHLLQKVVETCKQVGAKDAKFGYVTTDMNVLEQIDHLVTSSLEQFGGLDVVIINHGHMVNFQNPADLKKAMESLRTCLAVNVEAPAYLAGLVLPHLMETQGNLGIVNSVGGKLASKLGRPYLTSKFALDGYTRSLWDEMRDTNVSITNIVLGAVETVTARQIFDEAARTTDLQTQQIQTESPVDTAEYIMEGVTRRETEIYYPTYWGTVMLFRDIILRLDLFKF